MIGEQIWWVEFNWANAKIFMVKMFYKINVILGKYDITLLTPYVEQLGNWSNDAQRTCPFSILSY